MRALLIDAYHQVTEEITLPAETTIFYQQIKQYLHIAAFDTIHPNQYVSILFDPLAFTRSGTPAFLLGLMEAFPFFGKVICIGRNLTTYQMEDLPKEYTAEHFNITWYNPTESEACRKKSMQIGIDNYKS